MARQIMRLAKRSNIRRLGVQSKNVSIWQPEAGQRQQSIYGLYASMEIKCNNVKYSLQPGFKYGNIWFAKDDLT